LSDQSTMKTVLEIPFLEPNFRSLMTLKQIFVIQLKNIIKECQQNFNLQSTIFGNVR
jgi:hypothetical protein